MRRVVALFVEEGYELGDLFIPVHRPPAARKILQVRERALASASFS
jgi:hypothetical protein